MNKKPFDKSFFLNYTDISSLNIVRAFTIVAGGLMLCVQMKRK